MICELKNIGNPKRRGTVRRTEYYTRVKLMTDGYSIPITMKVDTGASCTVIGINNNLPTSLLERIENSSITGTLVDASGSDLIVKGVKLEKLILTDKIVIPEILMFFSSDMNDRSVLGMDILSLFDFHYKKDKGSSSGTFWINNSDSVISELLDTMKKRKLEYIDASNIMMLDNVDNMKTNELTTILNNMKGKKNTDYGNI